MVVYNCDPRTQEDSLGHTVIPCKTLISENKTKQIKTKSKGDWRDGSIVKSTGWSSTGPRFSSQHPMVAHNPLSPHFYEI